MEKHAIIILGCLLLNTLARANEADKNTHEEDSQKLDDKPYGIAENIQSTKESNSGQREKRFYNYLDTNFDFNLNPEFPSFIKRDQSYKTGNYGSNDQLNLIFRKLQEITSTAKQRTYLPPPQIPQPTFIPFFFIPRIDCPCSTNNEKMTTNRPLPNNKPVPDTANIPADSDNATVNKTIPDIPTRFPDIDESRDTRDNDGDNDYGDDSDGARPIRLRKPVKSNRPAPPLEHGSVQAGLEPSIESQVGDTIPPVMAPETDSVAESPSMCESAAIFCCHKHEVTYECFKSQGCNNPKDLGEPCSPQVMLQIINKLQYLYNLKHPSTFS